MTITLLRAPPAAWLLGIALASPALSLAATCTLSPQDPTRTVGQTVTWRFDSTGFSRSPRLAWTFQGGSPGSSTATAPRVSYATPGTFTTSLHLSRRGTVADCSTTVTVAQPADTDTESPTAPASLTAAVAGSTQVDLTWPASSDNVGVTGYRVERCTGASCTGFTQIASPTATSYSDTGVSAGMTYRYRVLATDAADNLSAYSPIADATLAGGDTEAPSISIHTPVGGPFEPPQTVTLEITATDNVAVTRIELYDGNSLVDSATSAPYAFDWSFTSADAGGHSWTAKAYDAAGNSATSNALVLAVLAPVPDVSINSTSAESLGQVTTVVPQQPQVASTSYSIVAINDLGMHCGDLDTRIASILPPFQVLLGQVIEKGGRPVVNPSGVTLEYSAVANPNDPILDSPVLDGLKADASTYKTNFWDAAIQGGAYDPFYPGTDPITGASLTPLAGPPFALSVDTGLPVPNVEDLYIGPDGIVDRAGVSADGFLSAVLHAMPGTAAPYSANAPQKVEEHYQHKPFFVNFPFGYVAQDVNWQEAAGIPFSAFDDFGRENAYPMVRLQVKNSAGAVLSTVDTVLPISGEASCTNCHADPADVQDSRSSAPTSALRDAGLPVATSLDDPDTTLPLRVSVEYAADINVLRLHDLKHGSRYVNTACDKAGASCLADPKKQDSCTIDADTPNGTDSCLTNKALVQGQPVVCQVCHYTPALDLAQLGPLAGPVGSLANGRNQIAHKSNSNVMHSHHGSLPGNLFPTIPAPAQAADGSITNQGARLDALENSCYQCHPGKTTKCLRGAMFNGGMLCSDCHGSMAQVGNDFSKDVSPDNPGAFLLADDFYTNPITPRVPWANEPGCGSCHTGDSNSNLTSLSGMRVNTMDTYGNPDGIRLRQAFKSGDAKATPIVPTNKRFAEPAVPASFNGFANPGAGNPQLYRVSHGHGGVMCEGCHGATHSEWPNANPRSNDNVTAAQLQGHTGTISECSTCHTTSDLPSSTQGGPHGMHLVNDSRFWREAHKDAAKRENGRPNGGACGACHGSDHLGTVLSRTPVDRSWSVESSNRTVAAGAPVGCNVCHSLSKSFGR